MTTTLIGLILLGLGAVLYLTARRAIFRRTNKYGVERFHSFSAKLRAKFGDHIAIWASIFLLLAGTLTLATSHMDSWGWVVMAPVAVFMFYLLVGLT
jgi:ATP/ADP translocase